MNADTEIDSPSTERLAPGLYIVATPIGNLGDITFRAADVLRRCDVIACEDTRVTAKLLAHLGIRKPLRRYDDHAKEHDRDTLLQSMHDHAVALVSDAGTPLISDPGYRLVNAAREAGIMVTSLPGAAAAIVGLTLSGLPNDRFLFAGFLPQKDKARRDVLEELAPLRSTLIFYETGPRLTKSLAAINEVLAGRTAVVARELTKTFEETRSGTPADLAEYYTQNPPKGEIVLLVGPPNENSGKTFDIEGLILQELEHNKASTAASRVAHKTGQDRREIYKLAVELKRRHRIGGQENS